MKIIVAVIVGLCFFAGYNVQAGEIKTDLTEVPPVELVAGAKSSADVVVDVQAEGGVVEATNEVELVADCKNEPQAVAEDLLEGGTDEAHSGSSGFVDQYIAGRLQIGTRMATRSLTDSDSGHEGGTYGSGTYLGTIYALEEVQDYTPYLFYMKYFFSDYIAAELAYDSVTAETRATTVGYSGDKTDGDVTLSGPTISLVAHIPNSTKFSPYASIGVGFYSGDFDEAASWALGYKTPSDYEDAGSPSTALNGRIREMVTDDAVGILLGLGCTYALNANWLLDISMQYTQVDVDATFNGYTYGVLDTVQNGNFPIDNIAFRLGLAYQF
ncbi:OmpW family outer membrane protein [Desulforhopalus sp. 52FAK]